MSHNNKDNQRPQPYQRNNELLSACPINHINNDFDGVDNQQHKHNNPINTKQRTRYVIYTLKPRVIVIYQTWVQEISEQQYDVHKIDNVRDGVDNVSDIKHWHLVVVELVVLVRHEKLRHCGN